MIQVDNVCKQFRLYRRPVDRVKERLFRRSFHSVHQALDNVSFSVPSGQTLGIIGHNGAGKSTLLKLLNGVLLPDSGRIHAGGRITGLLELGTGFNVDLSGLANIENNGLLIGMSREEVNARREAIIDFSELGDFIHEPLRTYSSGMVMRLGFAIAIHAQPDTFLVDEALAVGDAHFQQKCYRAIRAFREGGGSILLVSHDLNAIKRLSDQALLLDHGRVFELGEPEAVVNSYNFLVAQQGDADVVMRSDSGSEDGTGAHGHQGADYGDGRAQIVALSVAGNDSRGSTVSAGETTRIRVRYQVNQALPELTVGILVRDRFGQDIFGTNTYQLGVTAASGAGEWVLDFTVDMAIAPGRYSLSVALHTEENHLDTCHHWRDLAGGFEVAGVHGPRFTGVCRLPTTVRAIPGNGV
ncbi:ABC transporter ATP-binding protein [Chromatocurvus halotolerans]|uniref:Lipopolysaccharide transport system ATP-binding protein n=1 Tax=Chromatocurvus halotolerans TaxID=1132028 RepID=A0A4R2KRY0_9GAMM|nr:ABC transporter ATP-binding protein [Chromatocurvus halotolerans]TCO73756.1 lipopolysaccharide transport system ATP-binding protein [Chromatocurvus halotolerans]